MITADTPNLWEIKAATDHATAIGILVKALIHAARLVNVERNLNEAQIGEIANDLLEGYGYLKVEEVKYVLKQAVKTERIFARLDYNVVMNWFCRYDLERTETTIDISEQEEAQRLNEKPQICGAEVSFDDYVLAVKAEAEGGDAKAAEKLAMLSEPLPSHTRLLSEDERRQKELDFKRWYYSTYLNPRK